MKRGNSYVVRLSVPTKRQSASRHDPAKRFPTYEAAKEYCRLKNLEMIDKEGKPRSSPFRYWYVDRKGGLPTPAVVLDLE